MNKMPPKAMPARTERQVKLSCRSVWKVFGKHPERAFVGDLCPSPSKLKASNLVAANIDATFDVYKGETFVLMGLSGSGKSTLLRCLAQLDHPTSGQIFLDGLDLARLNPVALRDVRRKKMSMVFQHFALLPFLTVLENVAFPLEVQSVPTAEIEARSKDALELVGLSGFEDRLPRELSGGQQQRVGIARSLVSDPEVWLLDEPFSALDPMIRLDLQNEVIELKKRLQKTTLFVTHDLDEAVRLADRIAIMEGGRIVQIGTPEALILSPATPYVERFTSNVPKIKVARMRSIMHTENIDFIAEDPVVCQGALVRDHAEMLLRTAKRATVVDEASRRVGVVYADDVAQLMLQ